MNLTSILKSKAFSSFCSTLIIFGMLFTPAIAHSGNDFDISYPRFSTCFTEGYKFSDLKGLEIETERLIITPFVEDDVDKLSEYLLDKEITKYLDPSPSISDGFDTKEKAQKFLIGKGFDVISSSLEFTIKLKDSKTPIGKFDLMLEDDGCSLSLGYWLDKDFQGKGYMSEACFELCNKAFNASDIKSMYIACFFENSASTKLGNKIFDYIEKSYEAKKLSRTINEGIENGILDGKEISFHYTLLKLTKT